MLSFAIPLKSPKVSSNWNLVSLCFSRTLHSVFAQTNPNFLVYVAAHELPTTPYESDPRFRFIQINSAPPTSFEEQMLDKRRKIQAMASAIRVAGGGHVMKVDADDLVSRRLAQWVDDHPGHPGWIFRSGLELVFRHNQIRNCPRFSRLCGTSSIVNYGPEELPSEQAVDDEEPWDICSPHEQIESRRARVGRPLEELPFVGSLYVVETNENHSALSGNVGWKRRLMRRTLACRSVDESLIHDFSLNWISMPSKPRPAQPALQRDAKKLAVERPFTSEAMGGG